MPVPIPAKMKGAQPRLSGSGSGESEAIALRSLSPAPATPDYNKDSASRDHSARKPDDGADPRRQVIRPPRGAAFGACDDRADYVIQREEVQQGDAYPGKDTKVAVPLRRLHKGRRRDWRLVLEVFGNWCPAPSAGPGSAHFCPALYARHPVTALGGYCA